MASLGVKLAFAVTLVEVSLVEVVALVDVVVELRDPDEDEATLECVLTLAEVVTVVPVWVVVEVELLEELDEDVEDSDVSLDEKTRK